MMDFVLRVLQVTAEADDCDGVWWRTDGEYAPVTFFVNCNDLFAWGTADAEPVTPDNLALLEQAYADTAALGSVEVCWAGALFCARVRGMRPQGAAYPKDHPALWPLFDACGPPRAVSFGNPYTHPEDGGTYAYKAP